MKEIERLNREEATRKKYKLTPLAYRFGAQRRVLQFFSYRNSM
jgi:hypothetical protein